MNIALPKQKSWKFTAPLSTWLGCDLIVAKIIIQEDGAVDFASDLALLITVDNNIVSQVSAQEEGDWILNKNITLLALPIKYIKK